MSIVKICIGKFIQANIEERNCAHCNSLTRCMQQTQTNINKRFFSLNQLKSEELKTIIKNEKSKFFDFYKDASSERTIYAMWQIIQRLSIIFEIQPQKITIKHMIEYLEMREDNKSTGVIVSYLRRIAKEYYRFELWDTIKMPKRQKPIKRYRMFEEKEHAFFETPLYKEYDDWFIIYSDRQNSPHNIKNAKYLFENFLYYAYLKGHTDSSNKNDLLILCQKYIAEKGLADASKKVYRVNFKQYFESCLEMYSFKFKFKPFRAMKKKLKALPTETHLSLLSNYFKLAKDESWFYTLFLTLCYTGLRINEICNIKISDVDQEYWYFRLKDTKTGDKDTQIVSPLRPIITTWINYIEQHNPEQTYLFINPATNNKPSPSFVREHLKTVSNKLGIPIFTPHRYRDRIAIVLYEKSGWNISFVKDFLSHLRIATTEKYLLQFRKELMRQDYSPFIPDITDNIQDNVTKEQKQAIRKLAKSKHPDISDTTHEEYIEALQAIQS